MEGNAKQNQSVMLDARERLCRRVTRLAADDPNFVKDAVEAKVASIRELKKPDSEGDSEVICDLSDERLIEVLSEEVYFECLAAAYAKRLEAANRRNKTSMEKFWQLIADLHDRADDEPMCVDMSRMQVIKGSRSDAWDDMKEKVKMLIREDETELRRILGKCGPGNFVGDIVKELLGKNRSKFIELTEALLEADDEDFVRSVLKERSVPKPLHLLALCILKQMEEK